MEYIHPERTFVYRAHNVQRSVNETTRYAGPNYPLAFPSSSKLQPFSPITSRLAQEDSPHPPKILPQMIESRPKAPRNKRHNPKHNDPIKGEDRDINSPHLLLRFWCQGIFRASRFTLLLCDCEGCCEQEYTFDELIDFITCGGYCEEVWVFGVD
jgi:hypothetical protein